DHASLLADYVGAIAAEENVVRLGVWGLADPLHHSRVRYFGSGETVPNSEFDAQSSATLFDDDFAPKPVAEALVDVLRSLR
ncbi:MAG: hypothetical protein ACR2PF_01635, partial [Rhizobiaceae bacterium]